jgi:hypothetical protein
MRRNLTIVAMATVLVFMCCCAHPTSPALTQDLNMPQNMNFGGSELVRKNIEHNSTTSMAEYFPKTEAPDNFSKMYVVYFYPGHRGEPEIEAGNKKLEIKLRKDKGDIFANADVYKKESGVTIVDFTLSEGSLVEHNVMILRKKKGGLLVQKYVRRIDLKQNSDKENRKFFELTGDDRPRVFHELETANLPVPPMAR